MTTTLSELQAGNTRFELVLAIDGYPTLFSNADEVLVQAAWANTDWATKAVTPGLCVSLDNQQTLDPWQPFRGGGKLEIKVQVRPDSVETFARDLTRTDSGDETLLEETANRTSTLFVGFADGFPLQGEAHCGTEAFSYGFVSGRRLGPSLGSAVGSNRGKYVAFGVKDSVSTYGAVRFAEHHRVANQDNGVRFAPLVTEHPRTWKGRRASLWMHVYESDGSLNLKSDALCVFLGELSEPRFDDPHWSTVLFEHLLNKIPDTVLLRDQFTARVDYGLVLQAGKRFQFQDFDGTTVRTANDLVVVTSGASGTNQVNAGRYGHEEAAGFINSWLGGESGAGRIGGNYTLASPEDVDGVPRSVMHYFMPGTASTQCWFKITWPFSGWARPLGFLGSFWLPPGVCGGSHPEPSPYEVQPFDFVGVDQTGGTLTLDLEQPVGTFQDQRATLPAAARQVLASSILPHDAILPYGLFLLECETPTVLLGTVSGNRITRIRVLSESFTQNLSGLLQLHQAKTSVGKAPPSVRQIFVHEGALKTVLKWLAYSTGTTGYNHSDFDVLPFGQGMNVPYDALGADYEASCDQMPGADDVIRLVMDKPRKLKDVLHGDLVIRNAHLVFREGAFRWVSWTTPSSVLATTILNQTNKAEPIDVKASQRTTAVLDSSWVKNYVKINFNRDVSQSIGRGEDVYLANPIVLEDATSADEHGTSTLTLDLPNVYNDAEQSGRGVRALAAMLLSWFSHWARPLWKASRSIAPTLADGFGVGEVVALTDPDLRDPETGQRGVTTRPGLVTRHRFQLIQGPAPEKLKFAGEVDVTFLHADRVFAYGPAAEVDYTKNDGGFTAGWDGASTLQFEANAHSEQSETVDVGSFAIDDSARLIEIDADDPAAADVIDFQITGVFTATNRVTTDPDLSTTTPAFDTAKRYRMVYRPYPTAQASQTIKSFQAGSNKTIVQSSPPDAYGSYSNPPTGSIAATEYDHTKLPELLADASFGPNLGAVRDCGYDKELSLLVDNLIDHQVRRSAPAFSTTASTNSSNLGFEILRVEQHFIGDLVYGGGVNRYLHLAPHWRSTGTSDFSVTHLRVSISGYLPSGDSRVNLDNATPGYVIKAPAASNTWSVSTGDTNWQDGEPKAYPLGNFNGHQFVYIIIEGYKTASTRGLYTFAYGARFVA